PVQKRVQIVKQCLAGEPVASLAKRHGVSRETIYHWTKRVEEAMYSALADRPPLRRGVYHTRQPKETDLSDLFRT
ncbi:MAG: helix-turn-helix domain-containing protein, partial [Desulfotomaculales bacterium]